MSDDHIALRFDWEEVHGRRVTAILMRPDQLLGDGETSWDAVMIGTDDKAILVSVDIDTDQVEISLCDAPDGDWVPIPAFAFAKGLALGWCWIGRNSQGYKDSFTLAFHGGESHEPDPRCLFLAEASQSKGYDLRAFAA